MHEHKTTIIGDLRIGTFPADQRVYLAEEYN